MDSKNLITSQNLSNLIDFQLSSSKLKLDFKVIEPESENFKYNKILDFINENYITSNGDGNLYKLNYSISLFSFFAKNSIIIEFYPKNKDKVVGYIIGKLCNLEIYNQLTKSMEVNFLCLIPQLRNLGLSLFMKNVLANECIKRYNVSIAHYTSSHDINYPIFSSKSFYHRILNIMVLKNINWLYDKNVSIKKYEKLYNTFEISDSIQTDYSILYINDLTDQNFKLDIHSLYSKYISYCQKQFDIYDKIEENTFKSTFYNKAFHHFIILNKTTQELEAYLCYFELNTIYTVTNTICKTGYQYFYFFKNNDISLNSSFIELNSSFVELLHQYILSNNLFDLVNYTESKNFNIQLIKLVKGSSQLKYFLFNKKINTIKPSNNGLVTI
jgi:hypothetical protein